MTKLNVELTDTFSGEANYAWVRRAAIEVPDGASRALIVRRAKAAMRITGERCRVSEYGDTIDIRPYGACVVCFVTEE